MINKTDWSSYYRSISSTAKITRKITEILILRYFYKYNSNKVASIVELGGANSCFFAAIRKVYPQALYTIIDNNQFGIDVFKKKYSCDLNINLLNLDIKDPPDKWEQEHALVFGDLTFSCGLIEHFNIEDTAKVIARHFEITKSGGLVLITFPTPTWLYLLTRKLLTWLGCWRFYDERPLDFAEVKNTVSRYGEILHESINWGVILTQGIIVARRKES
jgi:hypothetical protein